MLDGLNGSTRVYFIVGDPIAQVKSPAGVTQALRERGSNAIVAPAHVPVEHLRAWFSGISLARNVDGVIVTVPHKFSAFEVCATVSERSRFLRAVNTMRRNPDGSWHGDMFDGLGFVQALRDGGCDLSGKRVLLIGAGGAGSAIAHAVLMAGVTALAICDESAQRCGMLINRLADLKLAAVMKGGPDPAGFDVVLNATPAGMRPDDPLPVPVDRLTRDIFVGCVITAPAISPLVAAARAIGCRTSTGADMFGRVRDLMVDFLLGPAA